MSTFIYIQTVDTGLAPCVYQRIWSLALCKPTIRRRASEGDIIIAVTPAKDGHKLSSWGKSERRVTTEEFSREYSKSRPDNIYEMLPNGRYARRHGVKHYMHMADLEHDLGKNGESAFVLIARDFFAFGKDAVKHRDWLHRLPQLQKEIKELGRSFRRNFDSGVDKELKQL